MTSATKNFNVKNRISAMRVRTPNNRIFNTDTRTTTITTLTKVRAMPRRKATTF